ncbi:MAG: hypothetical protein QOE90_859 [Thermoplasmata archaeon]|jgi:hypothetical protein|nr:hypothetical protein [Thermoplasmata archaeon]
MKTIILLVSLALALLAFPHASADSAGATCAGAFESVDQHVHDVEYADCEAWTKGAAVGLPFVGQVVGISYVSVHNHCDQPLSTAGDACSLDVCTDLLGSGACTWSYNPYTIPAL